MAKETQYTANTGMTTIATANSNLDGSGTLGTVLTAAANGTLIKTITVKAQGTTTHGMVRIFSYDGTNTRIIAEFEVPAITQSAKLPAFEKTIVVDYFIASGGIIKASTEKGESFNVIAQGLNFVYYKAVRPECTQYTAKTGMNTVTTANTSLTGSGTLNTDIWEILGASAAGVYGTVIQSVIVKAQVNTTEGMVRLFLVSNDATPVKCLLTEILVSASTKSGTQHSFSHRVDFDGQDFALKAGWKLYATTHNSESFNVIAEALDWSYPA